MPVTPNVSLASAKTSVLHELVTTSVLLARNTIMTFVQQPSASLLTACWRTPFSIPRRSQSLTACWCTPFAFSRFSARRLEPRCSRRSSPASSDPRGLRESAHRSERISLTRNPRVAHGVLAHTVRLFRGSRLDASNRVPLARDSPVPAAAVLVPRTIRLGGSLRSSSLARFGSVARCSRLVPRRSLSRGSRPSNRAARPLAGARLW